MYENEVYTGGGAEQDEYPYVAEFKSLVVVGIISYDVFRSDQRLWWLAENEKEHYPSTSDSADFQRRPQ